ncbi:RHS repeat-associated core domain-containing protein [Streptomyces sp. NPDC048445]|uniref:RHS repeat-associated core domain-containing protein n=1 Tax=Streptomyces sp. NPDC048445 TaxID=3365553 RepID=UPI00371C80C9
MTGRRILRRSVSQPYRFAGGYQDPTGLYHFAARYYDPNIGRFTTPDPSGQEQNPYLYAEGDPVNRIDPTGLFGFGDVVDGAVGLAKDYGSDLLAFAEGCIGGIGAAVETGAVAYASAATASPVGGVTAGALGCAAGGVLAASNASLITYG